MRLEIWLMKKAQRTGGYTWPVDAEENIAQTLAQFFYLIILSINLKESSETPFLRGLIICFYWSYHFLLQKSMYDTQIKIGPRRLAARGKGWYQAAGRTRVNSMTSPT